MIPKEEYASYFEQYMELVTKEGKSILQNLEETQDAFHSLLITIPEEKWTFAYDKDKWTLKELVQHIIDTERIFAYRALCFARKDTTDLPGFDQDIFVLNDNANERDFLEMLEEMQTLRKSSIQLFKSFSEDVFLRIGVASNNKMSVRALGYLFSGHQKHHFNIIKERYL